MCADMVTSGCWRVPYHTDFMYHKERQLPFQVIQITTSGREVLLKIIINNEMRNVV